jgi:hypothetical protein
MKLLVGKYSTNGQRKTDEMSSVSNVIRLICVKYV